MRVDTRGHSKPCIGEVNANCACMYVCLYVINRPVDISAYIRIAHAQKLARHTFVDSNSQEREERLRRRRELERQRRLKKQLNNVRYDWQGGENSIEHID